MHEEKSTSPMDLDSLLKRKGRDLAQAQGAFEKRQTPPPPPTSRNST